ncbi:Mitochondrial genome maintenance exonuclease 1 [Pseudolycoriella hygida]|uniref:Mitochondrial genome maintenance exonuclease 1 n=1 Tax=Pseudolycoriella hygida TaxID=35572 RepID=A0A9Q0NAF0_9DIPT|nr:Mitochondrial genome maintenance exonuclease 1 [Pseudolycoriella hygida]
MSLHMFSSIRQKSTSAVKTLSKADRIKLLNSTSKCLYGPVIKSKSKAPTRLKRDEPHQPVEKPEIPATPETNFSSEMFWVIGNKWNQMFEKNVGSVAKKQETEPTFKPKIRIFKSIDKASHVLKKSLEVEVPNSHTLEPTIVQKPILLSDEELKNVLKHPLLTNALTRTPIDLRSSELRNVPSVGKVLQYTMSESARAALMNWKLSKIRELGEQGFAELQLANLNAGTTFHASIQEYFRTNEIPIESSPVYKLWESVRGVLETFTAMPEAVEQSVFHPTLKYKGISDCVSQVNNEMTIIEWKRSGRSKPTLEATYDAPVQLCAYLGALNAIPEFQGRIKQGMIVVAYENGKKADVYKMNEVMLRKYWRVWLIRLHEFWIRSRDGTLPAPI